jgi:hypothetical protein
MRRIDSGQSDTLPLGSRVRLSSLAAIIKQRVVLIYHAAWSSMVGTSNNLAMTTFVLRTPHLIGRGVKRSYMSS